jgi:cholesterol oxidase
LDKIYYPRVRSILKPSPLPTDILASPYYLSTQVFLQQTKNAELPNFLIDVAVDWNIVRQEISGIKVPSAIVGEYWYGINSGAKNSLDKNYLAQAEATERVNILPLHLVTAISEVPGHGYRVECNQIDEGGGIVAIKKITCRYLFLAAGSMGTSALLVKAKATGTLPKLNDHIGLDWAGNGDVIAYFSGLPQPTNPTQGGPASAMMQYFNNPLGPLSIFPAPVPNLPEGSLTYVGMGIPSVTGKFTYDATTGLVRLTYPEDPKLLEEAKFAFRLLARKNATSTSKPEMETIQGSILPKNRTGLTLTPPVTAHPLGGAVLGKACDLYGRVMGYDGLYVVDGALIPGSTGCANPSFTIAAMAERNMERIIAEDIVT